ncbi:MAG: D-xylose 1-dehydrogenase D-xylono,5-lactone-forming [Gaiellaceae bacterium]|jgi:predicted dehydrogenase|nr:D-xylose 1-dehydrogenase D-xylono,5-lactone-forming [Gaiellaceae bacterium]
MEPVRWGILSTARINHAVLDPARVTDKAEVIAVASRDEARARAYATEHGIERAYGSYEELLADPDVEAVYNSLPNSMHVDWSIRALEAGKHVLVEKPFSRHPAEVERAFAVAEKAGLIVMEAFMYRHHPQTRKLEEVVSSGAIGELRQLRSTFSFTLDKPDDIRWRPELDGGALMDLGCYCVSGFRLLAGEPEGLAGFQHLSPTGVDARFAGLLRFPGGVLGEFHCAYDLPEDVGLDVIGSDGSIFVHEFFGCEDPHLDVNGERIDVEDVDRYLLQLENFSAAVRGDAKPLLGREDALGQARAIEALYRSAASG